MSIARFPAVFTLEHARVENAGVGINVVGKVPQKLILFRETLDCRLQLIDGPLVLTDGLGCPLRDLAQQLVLLASPREFSLGLH